MVVTDNDRTHWSFRPLQTMTPPTVQHRAWVRNGIDRFVLARLEAKGLKPAPEADRRTIVRRLTFDLAGLPPTPEQVEAFFATKRPTPIERLVDRLLASPDHGERWGRHWLDVARYADSDGYEGDRDRASVSISRLRHPAFNADMPFDQFVRWQFAGDQYRPDDPVGPRRDRLLHVRAQPGDDPGRHRREQGEDPLRRAGQHARDDRLRPARPDDRMRPMPRP